MLYIVATPVGNLEDITLRALKVLGEVDFILAEDTRKTGILLKQFNIKTILHSFYEHNELKKLPWIIEELQKGKKVALVSSAGVPTISDPGYKLVRECRKQGICLTSLPGPSSVINSLVLSSLPHDKFAFFGYFPRKRSELDKILARALNCGCTAVFFESPFRLIKSLEGIREILGNRKMTIAREMTKKFEEILEFTVEEALVHFGKNKPRGEFTVIIDVRAESAHS